MSASNAAPIIIKKKKVVGGGGHHGGAWKVAYADFVTAMMAFFMLMWLLNATTEQQRKGIADYFTPTIPINRISGGGDGAFGGESIFVEDMLPENGQTTSMQIPGSESALAFEEGERASQAELAAVEALRDVEDQLLGRGGESLISEQALRHVVTRVTDEGLIIELFDLHDVHLFEPGTSDPSGATRELAGVLARTFELVENDVAIAGHVRSAPLVLADSPVWELSMARADVIRTLMEAAGFDGARMDRVTGHADRELAVQDAFAARNNRIEIILLRSDQ